jgi:hypothetical protein
MFFRILAKLDSRLQGKIYVKVFKHRKLRATAGPTIRNNTRMETITYRGGEGATAGSAIGSNIKMDIII